MRQSDLEAKGIQGVTLARLVEDGSITRIGRGLYELSNAEVSLARSLAEVAARVPNGVVCLLSARSIMRLHYKIPEASGWQ